MAKTAKKKVDPTLNPRSRAAKRATSPSIDVDKSLKDVARASDATPILAPVRGTGGITKKRKTKQMTRGQRARQEKGLARAEAVMDQLAKKVEGSKFKRRRIDQRRGGWEDINHASKEETRKAMKAPGRDAAQDAWEDEPDNGDDIKMAATGASDIAPIPAATLDGDTNEDGIDLIT